MWLFSTLQFDKISVANIFLKVQVSFKRPKTIDKIFKGDFNFTM